MQDVFSIMQDIAPDLNEMLQVRCSILYQLQSTHQAIGRKTLAQKVNLSERSLRTIIQLMKEQHLVEVGHSGIRLTSRGQEVAAVIADKMVSTNYLHELSAKLQSRLGLDGCMVVSGNVEQDTSVYAELSRAVEQVLNRYLKYGQNTIAVTGGETLAHVGEGLTQILSKDRELVFVPARGGVGGRFNIQSNMVGGLMAQKTGAQYVPLFIPDMMEELASKALLNDPAINQAVMLGKQADCLLVSVGSAKTMAERRELTSEQQQLLREQQAIGEAFGVFFNEQGNEVLRLPRIGIQIEELSQIPLVVTVVAGASKAEAVKGYCQLVQHHGWLICDEGVANMILNEGTH
ncbi:MULTISPECIES: sugar-binding domain-containing protein [unclassified Facklamia]|uniref:sugar-binding transcriptional regulator n=1 Tax=Aerococcaceae TaxID=186827 RepID=UPI0013D51A6B|nr:MULTISPECIES: sugar-binding domain-containing protein [unclassified Facklamia]QQD65316.1 hypothetical protein JDW14_08465 [Aerococcaceae bacterium zg-252]